MAGLSARDYGGGLSTAGSSIVRAIGFSSWVCALTEEEADASVSLETVFSAKCRWGSIYPICTLAGWEKRASQDVSLTTDDGFDEDFTFLSLNIILGTTGEAVS